MATNSSIPAWRIPRTEEPGGLQSISCKELEMTQRLTNILLKGFSVCVAGWGGGWGETEKQLLV